MYFTLELIVDNKMFFTCSIQYRSRGSTKRYFMADSRDTYRNLRGNNDGYVCKNMHPMNSRCLLEKPKQIARITSYFHLLTMESTKELLELFRNNYYSTS